MNARNYVLTITVIVLILFFYTGMEKIWYHSVFHIMLRKQPLPSWMKDILDWGLPLGELVLTALLTITRTRLYGLWGSAIAMLLFAGYTAYAASAPAGKTVCACGKLFSGLSWEAHFWVNMGLAAMAFTGILVYHRNKRKTPQPLVDGR